MKVDRGIALLEASLETWPNSRPGENVQKIMIRRLLPVRFLGLIAALLFSFEGRADLCSSHSWGGTWSSTFTNGGFTWIADQTSPCWIISNATNYTTLLLSVAGTTGDFDFVLAAAGNSGSATITQGIFYDTGVVQIKKEGIANAFTNTAHAYFVILARRASGGIAISTPTCHGVGTSLAESHVLTFSNSGTTFYLGTDTSSFDGVGSFIAKCNDGTWISMGSGVDCASCLNPQVDLLGINGTGTVIEAIGVFDFGYNAAPPTEVDAVDLGGGFHGIYWHNDSATTGHWSTTP